MEILYLREGAIIGAELFLIGSRSIHTIISHHSASRGPADSKLSVREEEQEESEREEEAARPKRKGRSRLGRVAVESGGYELYDPHENVSNFTVRAESANLEVFCV